MPSFTAGDMDRFRSARGTSIWARRGDIAANGDALVIIRHDIVEECRELIQKEIKTAEEASARAQKNGSVDEATIFAAIAAKLSAVRGSLQNLVDMESYRKLKGS
jgi:hypothetical protein